LLSFGVDFFLSSGLLYTSKNTKTKIYRTVILPVVYGCEAWSPTLTEKRRLRMFENRVLGEICGSERGEATGNGENYIMRSLMMCTADPVLFGWPSREG
jgi:hypothetical protein